MKVNKAGIDLIKRFEGKRLKAYKDSVGVWTIGYGHTSMAGSPKVKPGMRITEKEAVDILVNDVNKFARGVERRLKINVNANQFAALVSFAYNVGLGNFKRSSVLKRTNEARFKDVPGRLMLWNKAGGKVLKGLTRRRKAEGELFAKRVAPSITVGKPAQAPKADYAPTAPEPNKKPQKAASGKAVGITAALIALIAAASGAAKPIIDWFTSLFG